MMTRAALDMACATGHVCALTYTQSMAIAPRSSFVEELRSNLARALEALASATRGQKPASELERDVAELRERVEYLEDSLAAFEARTERDEKALRPWDEVRR
jgi:predicted RecB family endonuclease